MTKRLLVLLAVAAMAIASSVGGSASSLQLKAVFTLAHVGPQSGGGEPSITTALDGTLYVSYPGPGMGFFRSKNHGKTWVQGATADPSSGDTSVNVDSSGAVYQSNLRGINVGPGAANSLETDLYKSLDGGKTWPQKATSGSNDSASGNMFHVDRQWFDAYIPAGKKTSEARVYASYHDWVLGLMWANVSKDGGKTFSAPIMIMSDPVALADGFCNVIPGGTKVVQSGPHAGRVYIVWLSGNVATNATTGCNYTQMDTFGQVWSAYSDTEGKTWTDQLVYDAGPIGHDASYIFADVTLDRVGNPYVAFALNDAPPPHTATGNDQWNVFVEASFDGGKTYNGSSTGTGAPYKVTTDTGTHIYPAITAGDPGKVAVAYLATPVLIPQLPYGKAFPGGDPNAKWNVFVARSFDLKSGHPTWTTDQLTTKPMHTGDICNLGIFCITKNELGPPSPGISNRDILDFIDIVGDPEGMVHVAYTDTETPGGAIVAANQVAGLGLIAVPTTQTFKIPAVPITVPKPKTAVLGEHLAGTGVTEMPLLGVLLVAGAAVIARRLRRTA